MSTALNSPGTRLRATWRRLSPLPGGRWLFSRLLRLVNPYSGAVGATVMTLEPGHAVVVLKERRAVHNHLDSVHAIALANIAEMASGLAMLSALPDSARGIPTALSIDYLKSKGKRHKKVLPACDSFSSDALRQRIHSRMNRMRHLLKKDPTCHETNRHHHCRRCCGVCLRHRNQLCGHR